MKKYNRNKEELKNLVESVNKDFHKHYRKVGEIVTDVVLAPEQAIEIAKEYHQKKKLDGVVDEEVGNLYFDEAYTFKVDPENKENNDVRPAWRITVDLKSSSFVFEDYTLIVGDQEQTVIEVLDVNGQPSSNDNEFTDEDIEYIMSNKELEDNQEN